LVKCEKESIGEHASLLRLIGKMNGGRKDAIRRDSGIKKKKGFCCDHEPSLTELRQILVSRKNSAGHVEGMAKMGKEGKNVVIGNVRRRQGGRDEGRSEEYLVWL